MARLWVLLLAGCSTSPGFEERNEWRRGSVQLRILDVEAELGKPLRVTLHLRNDGSRPLLYEARGVERESFDLLGPDGQDVPYIGWPPSSPGDEKALDSRSSESLLNGYDLSTEYLIDRPGRYRLRFSGRGLRFWKAEEAGPGLYPIRLVSEWTEFTVREGEPPAPVEIARRLRSIAPAGWRVHTGSFDSGSWVLRLLRSSRRNDEIDLVVGRVPAELGYRRLAEGRWGPVCLKDGHVVEDGLLRALLDALTRP